jgi:hypothetical protein
MRGCGASREWGKLMCEVVRFKEGSKFIEQNQHEEEPLSREFFSMQMRLPRESMVQTTRKAVLRRRSEALISNALEPIIDMIRDDSK